MNDDRHLDDLEQYLRHAAVLDSRVPTFGGAHGGKNLVLLEGGVFALAKPEVGIGACPTGIAGPDERVKRRTRRRRGSAQ